MLRLINTDENKSYPEANNQKILLLFYCTHTTCFYLLLTKTSAGLSTYSAVDVAMQEQEE